MQETSTIPERETIMRTVSRAMPDRTFIIAKVGLHYIEGNRDAYWSATCDIYDPHGTWSGEVRWRNGREMDGGGAAHEEILRAFPWLAPIVSLHLADSQGIPMYAVENPRFHIHDGHPEHAASILRCAVDDLPTVDELPAYVEAQRDRWHAEALEAWRVLQGIERGNIR